jgi:nucleoside-diphosphate-sugar epimerase
LKISKKVLVTDGLGFIGLNMVREWKNEKMELGLPCWCIHGSHRIIFEGI